MLHERIHTAIVDNESLPWVPFAPHAEQVQVKYFRLDPVRGEVILMIKSPASAALPRHYHSGSAIVFTISGRWKEQEHEWIAGPGSLVFHTATCMHTPQAHGSEGHAVTLNIVLGDTVFLDDQGQVLAIENWKTALRRYLDYCERCCILPRDLTALC